MSYLVDFQVNPSGFVPNYLVVQTTGNQNVSGVKTFLSGIKTPTLSNSGLLMITAESSPVDFSTVKNGFPISIRGGSGESLDFFGVGWVGGSGGHVVIEGGPSYIGAGSTQSLAGEVYIKGGKSSYTGANIHLHGGVCTTNSSVFGDVLIAESGGRVGINTGLPLYTFDVNGTGNFKSLYINGTSLLTGSNVPYTVFTTGNQYISGQKTFFDQLTVSGKTGAYWNIPFTSGNWSGITNNIQFNSTGASITGSSFIYGELIHTGHILSGNKNYKITTIVSGYPTQVELWVGNQRQYFFPSYPLVSGYNILTTYSRYNTSGYLTYKSYGNLPRLTFVNSEVVEITGNTNIIENDAIFGGKLVSNQGLYINGQVAINWDYNKNCYYIPALYVQNILLDYNSVNTIYSINPNYSLAFPYINCDVSTNETRFGDYGESYLGNYIYINNNGSFGGVGLMGYFGKIYTSRDEWSPVENVLDDGYGNMGVGVEFPSCKLDVNGLTSLRDNLNVSGYGKFVSGIRMNTYTPASAGAVGTSGQIAWDSNYLYVCVATNTWKRAALSTW